MALKVVQEILLNPRINSDLRVLLECQKSSLGDFDVVKDLKKALDFFGTEIINAAVVIVRSECESDFEIVHELFKKTRKCFNCRCVCKFSTDDSAKADLSRRLIKSIYEEVESILEVFADN